MPDQGVNSWSTAPWFRATHLELEKGLYGKGSRRVGGGFRPRIEQPKPVLSYALSRLLMVGEAAAVGPMRWCTVCPVFRCCAAAAVLLLVRR